jgi:hypothetical protein
MDVKLFEPRLVECCQRQSALLEPMAETDYQRIFGFYGLRSVTIADKKLRKFVYVSGQ